MRRGLQDPKHRHWYGSLLHERADPLASPLRFSVQADNETTYNHYTLLLDIVERFQERILDVVIFAAGFEHLLIRRLDSNKDFLQVGLGHEVDHFGIMPQVQRCLRHEVEGLTSVLRPGGDFLQEGPGVFLAPDEIVVADENGAFGPEPVKGVQFCYTCLGVL